MSDPKISMDIPVNADVHCSDGRSGKVVLVIINPVTRKLSNVVVQYHAVQYLVPLKLVAATTPDLIVLGCTRKELTEMESFVETHFINAELAEGFLDSDYFVEPYVYPEIEFAMKEEELIPAGELAIRRGNEVFATDGEIGTVDEFVVNRESNAITHIILREGHLWGKKDITIPVGAIREVDENRVFLLLDKDKIAALPAMRVSRWWD